MSASSIKTLPDSPSTLIDSPKHPIWAVSSDGPSQIELVFLWLVCGICFIIVLTHFKSYSGTVLAVGDNSQYISAAQAIQHLNLRSTQTRQGGACPM